MILHHLAFFLLQVSTLNQKETKVQVNHFISRQSSQSLEIVKIKSFVHFLFSSGDSWPGGKNRRSRERVI